MRNSFTGIFAIATMALMGCSQEDQQFVQQDTNEVFTGIIKVEDSRTSLGDNGMVIWSDNDLVSIFKKSGYHQKYKVEKGGNANATFKYAGESQEHNVELDKNYAVYPYSVNHTISAEKKFELELSSLENQVYTENSFENGKSVMTAKSANTELYFYNALSMIRFKLWSDVPGAYSINKITLTSKDNSLNGNATVDMTKDKPVAVFNENGEKTSILTIDEAVVLTEEGKIDDNGVATGGHDFYMLVPAGEYAKEDLTILIEGEDENGEELKFEAKYPSNDEGLTLERSAIHTISHEFTAETWTGVIEPSYVSKPAQLKEAFAKGGKVILEDNIELEERLNVAEGSEVYLDMNEKTITVKGTSADPAFYTYKGSTLTITGNGKVEIEEPSVSLVFPGGDVVIENGTFVRNVPAGTPVNQVGALFVGAKVSPWGSQTVTINGGYFDGGYYNADAADIDEILAGTKEFTETADDIAKRNNSKDANKVRVAIKQNVQLLLNLSYNLFKVYGGTFVGANPAWGDEGCMLPTTPNYLRPWSYYQGALLDGQTFNENGLVIPTGYNITKGTHADGRPTYTVSYNN